jgi:hypothetical protein
MERHESKAITKRRCVVLDKITLMEKGIKIPTLSNSCGHK